MVELGFKEINPPEKKRTYIYPEGSYSIVNVSKVAIRSTGTHRLETTDGKKIIVRPGWLAIELEMDAWTF